MNARALPLISLLLILTVFSAGCLTLADPTPTEAKIRGNIIYLDPQIMDPDFIWSLVMNPNAFDSGLIHGVDTYLEPANSVIEVGAGIGVLSCYINEKLMFPTQQVSVEPNPYLIPTLEKTKAENKMSFTILQEAVSYGPASTATISVESSIMQNRITESSAFTRTAEVPATTIEKIAGNANFGSNITLVMNIIGYEHDVIQNEPKFIRNTVGTMIVAVYSDEKNTPDTFSQRMKLLGFAERERVQDVNGNHMAMVFENEWVRLPTELTDTVGIIS